MDGQIFEREPITKLAQAAAAQAGQREGIPNPYPPMSAAHSAFEAELQEALGQGDAVGV